MVGWLYTLLTVLMAPLLILIASSLLSSATNTDSQWWLWALAGFAGVTYVNVLGVQSSSRTNIVLGFVEIVIFAVLSLWLIAKAGGDNTIKVFGASLANVPDHTGLSGVIAGATYSTLAFSGFESSTVLAEETSDPRRNIPRAIVLSLVAIVILEVISQYAVTVAVGPAHTLAFTQVSGLGQSWRHLADTVWAVGAVLVIFAVANSCLANANAGYNSSTRTLFALGRAGLLPSRLRHVDPRRNSPTVAISVQFAIGLAVTLGLGAGYGPAVAFGIVGTAITLAFVLLYMSMHVACGAYYARHERAERHVVLHVIVPIVGFVLLIPELFEALGVKVFDFIAPIAAPYSYGAIAVWAWLAIGAVYLGFIRARGSERVGAMSLVFDEA
jgi:amino acid transporter